MVAFDQERDVFLYALSDEYMRRILSSIATDAKSMEQICKESEVPVSTCYRRVHQALKLKLARVESTIINAEGKKHETFRSTLADVRISFSEGVLSVEVTRARQVPAERLPNLWGPTRRELKEEDQHPQRLITVSPSL